MRVLKKIIFLIVFGVGFVWAFEIVLNTGTDNNSPFATLHLKNDKNFTCLQKEDYFECEIPGVVDSELSDQQFDFFDLKFKKNELNTQLFIYPKVPAKRYNLAQNLYDQTSVKSNLNDTNSTSFTFIFTKEVPYFKEYDGLDFDIQFPNVNNPSIGALDLESNPVAIPQSADINTFLRIKRDYDEENYIQVIADTTNAINRYQGSIFINEFMLYRLRAKIKLYTDSSDYKNQPKLEEMIEEIKTWNRNFASDKNYTEVLYIMMRVYMALEQKSNVDYVVGNLGNEHPDNYFTQLALLDYADYLTRLGSKPQAQIIYNDLYYKTQNLDIASRSALSLAKFALIDKNNNKAYELINTVMGSNKPYFAKNKPVSLDIAKILYDNENYPLSADVYEAVFGDMKEFDEKYEETLRNLALAQSKTQNYQKADEYLDLYMQEFKNSEYLALIKEASDNIFFNLPENNATFLHQRYKELQAQYANEIASKAVNADVKLYFDENNTQAVLDYKNIIERYDNPSLKEMLEKSATTKLNESLKADDCPNSALLYEEYAAYDIGQKITDKKALLNCFKRTLRTVQAKAYIDKNRADDVIYYDLQKAELDLNDKEYNATINASNGVLNSRLIKSDDEKFRANYYKFLAQLRQGSHNEAMMTLKNLENFPMDYRMVELYNEFLLYCVDKNLTTSILTYAPKAIDFQNLKGVNVYTPELEFAYLGALNKTNQPSQALEVLTDLLKVKLEPDDKARAFYIQSQIFEKMQDTTAQRQSLTQCIDINATTSSWQSLCKQRLDILEAQN